MIAMSSDKRERIEAAKAKMQGVVDHLLYLLEIQANNTFIVYSPVISKQIPKSFAANAFNVFQRSAHQYEIVRLCALWDGVRKDRENIPTVVALVDDSEIIEMLAEETRKHWDSPPDPRATPSEQRAFTEIDRQFGLQQAHRVRIDLRTAIGDAQTVLKTPQLEALMNARHKHLAHNLTSTAREKEGPVDPIRYGDETDLTKRSTSIVEALYRCVNGTSFTFKTSQEFYQRNAASLWQECRFTIVD